LIVGYLRKIIELRKENHELKTVAENQRKIISILAHDVRGPLASIKSVFDLKDMEFLDRQDSTELMGYIKIQLDSTMEMVDDIVNWGQLSLQPTNYSSKLLTFTRW
jgi:light-regulated signal transduction histidine kinase (bacteriophytochrome)